jgi:hypothetical protein
MFIAGGRAIVDVPGTITGDELRVPSIEHGRMVRLCAGAARDGTGNRDGDTKFIFGAMDLDISR